MGNLLGTRQEAPGYEAGINACSQDTLARVVFFVEAGQHKHVIKLICIYGFKTACFAL
jgi:hypothetical protein